MNEVATALRNHVSGGKGRVFRQTLRWLMCAREHDDRQVRWKLAACSCGRTRRQGSQITSHGPIESGAAPVSADARQQVRRNFSQLEPDSAQGAAEARDRSRRVSLSPHQEPQPQADSADCRQPSGSTGKENSAAQTPALPRSWTHPLFRRSWIHQYQPGQLPRKAMSVKTRNQSTERMPNQDHWTWNLPVLEQRSEIASNSLQRGFAGECAPAKSRAIIRIGCAELSDPWLDQVPTQRRVSDP